MKHDMDQGLISKLLLTNSVKLKTQWLDMTRVLDITHQVKVLSFLLNQRREEEFPTKIETLQTFIQGLGFKVMNLLKSSKPPLSGIQHIQGEKNIHGLAPILSQDMISILLQLLVLYQLRSEVCLT